MREIDNFISYCNSMMIANEGLFSSVKKIFTGKKPSPSYQMPVLNGYEVGEPISGYDPIYSTKEKRASLVKDVLQIANKVRAQSQFKKDGIGIEIFRNMNELQKESYYRESYEEFINGESNGCDIGQYDVWDYAKLIGENARQMEDTAVSDFIEETLNNAVSQKFTGVKITSEGGDWDDGPISIVIKRW